MKRYWLFSYYMCYPLGGMRDFTKDFESIKEAKTYFENGDKIGCNIFDSETQVVVYDSNLKERYEVHGFDNIEYDEDKKQLWQSVTDSHLKNLYPIDLWD